MGSGHWSESEASSSESISRGSGSASKVGAFLGMCLSPVNVNAPDSLRNSARAAIPLGVPSSSGRAISLSSSCRLPGACSYYVFAGLSIFAALAGDAFLGEELPAELACVCVASTCG